MIDERELIGFVTTQRWFGSKTRSATIFSLSASTLRKKHDA